LSQLRLLYRRLLDAVTHSGLRILLARYGLLVGASMDASALLQELLTSPKCV
jgi:hypothetical protein